MSRPGPPPTPTQKLRLRGSWRAKTRPGEPRPKPTRPRAPAWLSKDAKSIFNAVVRQLYAEGMVTRLDEATLARYADQCVQYRQASEFLAKFGSVYAVPARVGPDGKALGAPTFRTYPHAQRALVLSDKLMRMEEQFGMTPASRARLVAQVPESPAPQFDHYFHPVRVSG